VIGSALFLESYSDSLRQGSSRAEARMDEKGKQKIYVEEGHRKVGIQTRHGSHQSADGLKLTRMLVFVSGRAGRVLGWRRGMQMGRFYCRLGRS
jgi:hypothetical protein